MSKNWTEERVSHWFITAWAEQFADAVRARDTRHETPLAPLAPGEPHPEVWEAWTEPLWYCVEADVKAGAELFIGCARHTAFELSGTEESAAPPDSNFSLSFPPTVRRQANAEPPASSCSHKLHPRK